MGNRSGSKSNRRDGAMQRTRRIGFELLESRCLLSSIGFSAISNVTVPSGQTIFVPLDSSDSGNTVSYTVTASDYSKLTPVMMPSTNKSVQFNVLINGVAEPMTFQLFDNLCRRRPRRSSRWLLRASTTAWKFIATTRR